MNAPGACMVLLLCPAAARRGIERFAPYVGAATATRPGDSTPRQNLAEERLEAVALRAVEQLLR